jgi:hypothetical protein
MVSGLDGSSLRGRRTPPVSPALRMFARRHLEIRLDPTSRCVPSDYTSIRRSVW